MEISTDKIKTTNTNLLFCKEHIKLKINNIKVHLAHVIQQVALDEIDGYCLDFDYENFYTNDGYILEYFIKTRINSIPIYQNISINTLSDTKYELNMSNNTNKNMNIYVGDMSSIGFINNPLFNPSHLLCILRPHKMIKISLVNIIKGNGNTSSNFSPFIRTSVIPLDILEYTTKEINTTDIAYESGYKKKEDAKKFLVSLFLPCVPCDNNESEPVSKKLLMNIMIKIKEMIRQILLDYMYDFVENENDILMNINIPKHNNIMGNLITNAIYDLDNTILFTGYNYNEFDNNLHIIIKHNTGKDAIKKLFLKTLAYLVKTYDNFLNDVYTNFPVSA
jgi:hypothetical protein